MIKAEEFLNSSLEYFDGDELAANVFDKYALKDRKGNILESNPEQMHKRLAKEFARMENKFGGDRQLSEKEILKWLKNFNSIVPQGSPMYGIGNDYVNVSLSNCVVVDSPRDSISSIMESGKELANLFARRCGVGIDISTLRPEKARVKNSAGTSTGAWSFADFYSYVCRMIGQNNRRGALMISMDVRHPDIEKFVVMKKALKKVTGANVSVKITDEFMKAVDADLDFELKFPIDSENPKYTKIVKAKELWQLIVESAATTAEPGLLMWDNILNNLPAECYKEQGFRTVTTNPCGEIPLSKYDSCRLISINLKNFVVNSFDDPVFDFDAFKKTTSVAMRLSDDLVELEIEKLAHIVKIVDTESEKILWSKMLETCKNGRRTGLGTHGLADTLACLNLAYDSEEALTVVDKIYKILRDEAYEESVRLAQERGAFPVFDWTKEQNNLYIKRLPKKLRTQISKFGRRNISLLTNAPTGSVSILSQTSSGIEPVFRNWYIRRRKLNHDQLDEVPDFVDDLGDKWKEYKVFHHNVQQYKNKFKLNGAALPEFFVTSEEIDWKKRIEIQATIQKYIDHSISSTINLPRNTSPEVVSELYFEGWKKGLKGVTVYVDGSRSGVLVTEKKEKESFPQRCSPKRPVELECDIHHTTIQGEPWTVLVGLFDNKPYEVMGGKSDLIEIPKKYEKGILIKHSRKTTNSKYDLKFGGDEKITVKDIVRVFDNPNHSAFTRMLSLALRHGAKTKFLVQQLMKDRESDVFSFSKCVARVLKKYIPEGDNVNGVNCEDCGSELIYIEGCVTCKSCGFSKCG